MGLTIQITLDLQLLSGLLAVSRPWFVGSLQNLIARTWLGNEKQVLTWDIFFSLLHTLLQDLLKYCGSL